MIRQFLKEGSIYTLSNIATKGVSLLLIPFYTSYFSPADYGVLDYLSVFTSLINLFVGLEIGQGVSRYLGDPKLSELERKKIGSTGINMVVLLYFLSMVGMLLTTSFWTKNIVDDNSISDSLFRLAIINTSINAIFYQLGIHLRYKRKTKAFAVLSFAQTFANMSLIFIFVAFGRMGIEAIYWASIIVAPIMISIQFYILRHEYFLFIGKQELKKILAFSIPLVPATLSLLILDVTDRVLIAKYISIDQLGVYGVGGKFPAILTLMISGFSMALAPIVVEKYELDSTKEKMEKLLNSYLILGGILVLILSLFSYETLFMFTNKNYYDARYVMPMMYFIAFLNGISMFSVGLFLSKKTYIRAIVTVLCALVNLGLNFWLIPLLGIYGAGLSTLISIFLNTVLIFYYSSKYYFYAPNGRLFLILGIFIAGIISMSGLELIDMSYFSLLASKILLTIGLLLILFIYSRKKLRE